MLCISISTSYRRTSHSQDKTQRYVNLLLVRKVDCTLHNIPHAKYSRKRSFKVSTVLRLMVSCQSSWQFILVFMVVFKCFMGISLCTFFKNVPIIWNDLTLICVKYFCKFTVWNGSPWTHKRKCKINQTSVLLNKENT